MAPEQSKSSHQPIDLMTAMKDKLCEDSPFSIEQVVDQLKKVNIHLSPEECYLLLCNVVFERNSSQEIDPKNISKIQFSQLFDALDNRIALRVLFEKYSTAILKTMGPEQLKIFFEKEQGKERSSRYCRQLISQVNYPGPGQQNKLTLNGFYRVLSMDSFGLFNPVHQKPCQDMSKSLTHYYVATSVHIRYPEDEQNFLLQMYPDIKASSQEEATILAKYRDLLLNGCRCLQITLHWDDNTFFIPVRHQSLYYYMPIDDFLTEVSRSAFKNCHLPVILQFSSEHLLDKSKILFDHVESKLQGYLYKPSKKLTKFPDLKSLQNKILVYSRVPNNSVDICRLLTDENDDPQTDVNLELANLHDNLSKVSFWDSLSVESTQVMCQIETSVVLGESERNKWPTICERNLISLHSTESQEDWSQMTVNLIRVGVQLIPLQREHIIARALFQLNGQCGYVLKPIYLRKGHLYKRNSSDKLLKNELPSSVNKYTVRIICVQNLMHYQDNMNTSVTMRVIGHEKDNLTKFSTKVCSSDGLVPFWNEQTRFWIVVPDLAFLYFEVTNNDEMIGYHVIPVKAILKGNRHVPLYNRQHRLIENAKLFLHIDYKEIVSGWYPADPDPPQEDLSETVDSNGT